MLHKNSIIIRMTVASLTEEEVSKKIIYIVATVMKLIAASLSV